MRICSLITLFNPDINKLEKNLVQILTYAEKIFLLVNSQDKPILNNKDDRISIIMNNKNIGLSKAFNIGLKLAQDEGFEMAILFDQDSFLSHDNYIKLYNEYITNNKISKVMCIGPSLNIYGNIIHTPKWTLYKTTEKFENVDAVKNIITSGMLLNINYALSIGGFNENFPVDFCDFMFCWRAIYNGYYVLKSKDAYIIHEIGNSQMKIGKSTIHFHAPYRNYFLVRDTLNICLKERETPLLIRIRYMFFLLPRMILFILRCDRKKERIQMYYKGFKDFLFGKRKYGSIAKIMGAIE